MATKGAIGAKRQHALNRLMESVPAVAAQHGVDFDLSRFTLRGRDKGLAAARFVETIADFMDAILSTPKAAPVVAPPVKKSKAGQDDSEPVETTDDE